jgi:hypothetical protein
MESTLAWGCNAHMDEGVWLEYKVLCTPGDQSTLPNQEFLMLQSLPSPPIPKISIQARRLVIAPIAV